MSPSSDLPPEPASDHPLDADTFSPSEFPPLPSLHPPSAAPPSSDPGSAPTSWSNKLFSPSAPTPSDDASLQLRFIPPSREGDSSVALCPCPLVTQDAQQFQMALVGQFLGSRPPFLTVKSASEKMWRCRGQVSTLLLHEGAFLFKFSDSADLHQVLERGVWFIGRKPMIVRPWDRTFSSASRDISSLPLWVNFPGLPLHLWNVDALSSISSLLGKPLFMDRRTLARERLVYARVCVQFDAAADLPETISIRDDEENLFLQQVVYEWIPARCDHCSVFGHSLLSCSALESQVLPPSPLASPSVPSSPRPASPPVVSSDSLPVTDPPPSPFPFPEDPLIPAADPATVLPRLSQANPPLNHSFRSGVSQPLSHLLSPLCPLPSLLVDANPFGLLSDLSESSSLPSFPPSLIPAPTTLSVPGYSLAKSTRPLLPLPAGKSPSILLLPNGVPPPPRASPSAPLHLRSVSTSPPKCRASSFPISILKPTRPSRPQSSTLTPSFSSSSPRPAPVSSAPLSPCSSSFSISVSASCIHPNPAPSEILPSVHPHSIDLSTRT